MGDGRELKGGLLHILGPGSFPNVSAGTTCSGNNAYQNNDDLVARLHPHHDASRLVPSGTSFTGFRAALVRLGLGRRGRLRLSPLVRPFPYLEALVQLRLG